MSLLRTCRTLVPDKLGSFDIKAYTHPYTKGTIGDGMWQLVPYHTVLRIYIALLLIQ